MKSLLLAAFLGVTCSSVQAGDFMVPVQVGGHPKLDACTSLGVVVGLRHSKLAVRAGPATIFRQIDAIVPGQNVYICEDSYDRAWHGVVYSADSAIDCGVTSPVASAGPYHGPCKSGWVRVRWVKVVAG